VRFPAIEEHRITVDHITVRQTQARALRLKLIYSVYGIASATRGWPYTLRRARSANTRSRSQGSWKFPALFQRRRCLTFEYSLFISCQGTYLDQGMDGTGTPEAGDKASPVAQQNVPHVSPSPPHSSGIHDEQSMGRYHFQSIRVTHTERGRDVVTESTFENGRRRGRRTSQGGVETTSGRGFLHAASPGLHHPSLPTPPRPWPYPRDRPPRRGQTVAPSRARHPP